MATPKKISDADIKKARSAGVKAKKPRKPKTKSLNALEGYIGRYNAWIDKLKEGVKKFNKMQADKKRQAKLKATIGAL